jgi:predicted aspartyl protease
VTIDTGASATVARPDIVAGLPERELSRPYVLQTASGETIPVVKEARVELTIGRRTLRSWVFVADIADDFVLGLDILRAYDASVDIGRRVLRLGQDEVPVREAPTAVVLKRTRPTENRRNDGRCVGSAGGPVTSGEGVLGGLLRKQSTEATGGGTVQLEGEAKPGGSWQLAESARTPPCLTHSLKSSVIVRSAIEWC